MAVLLSIVLIFIVNTTFYITTLADKLVFDYNAYSLNAEFGTYPHHEHKSTKTTSPLLLVNLWQKDRMSKTGSHIFLRNDANGDSGPELDTSPLILSAEDLSAVYIDRRYQSVFDVRVQKDNGKDYLTFFGGPISGIGLGDGYSYVFDTSYRQVHRVAAQKLDVKADLHEFELTGNGTALLTAYDTIAKPYQIRDEVGGRAVGNGLGAGRGGRRGLLRDSVFQEIELDTNELLFQWRASEHIPLADSFEEQKNPWDFFHLNSIQKTADSNYLLCARHTHAIYLINGTSGDVIWTMGGRSNQFVELPPANGISVSNPALSMSWQHHARFYSGSNETEITLFDNHALPINGFKCMANCSRGLHLRINTSNPANMTVQILHEYLHPKGMLSQSQGSVQILDNGNVFIGWGRNPTFTEHTVDGECIFDVQFSPWRSPATNGDGLDNYRTYRMDWKATPFWDPVIAVDNTEGILTVYLSWNGATEVKSWVLLASDSPNDILTFDKTIARVPRAGFETTIHLGYSKAQYLRAAALDSNQGIIGSTDIFEVRTKTTITTNVTISATMTSLSGTKDEVGQASTGSTSQLTGVVSDAGHGSVRVNHTALELINIDALEWGTGWKHASLLFMLLGLMLSGYALISRRKHLKNTILHAWKNPDYTLPKFNKDTRTWTRTRVDSLPPEERQSGPKIS